METWKQSSTFKRLIETLLLAIKMCSGFTTYVIWMNTRFYSVTSEITQSSRRRVSSFKDLSALLNNWEVKFTKYEILLIPSTLLVLRAKNIYRNTSKMHITMETELSL